MRWAEIDLSSRVWTVPAERMKAGREHRVPLSQPALNALEGLGRLRPPGDADSHVFPGARTGRPLSPMSFQVLLRAMALPCTAHGFRSSFRDWAGECTDHPREVAEAALAHLVGDATERAYRRGDALERRRKLMADWARFCAGEDASHNVEAA